MELRAPLERRPKSAALLPKSKATFLRTDTRLNAVITLIKNDLFNQNATLND